MNKIPAVGVTCTLSLPFPHCFSQWAVCLAWDILRKTNTILCFCVQRGALDFPPHFSPDPDPDPAFPTNIEHYSPLPPSSHSASILPRFHVTLPPRPPDPTQNQGAVTSRVVSCTGSQYCGLALVETKNRAVDLAGKLDAMLNFPEGSTVPRIHWTGCPNSCGQAQVRCDVERVGWNWSGRFFFPSFFLAGFGLGKFLLVFYSSSIIVSPLYLLASTSSPRPDTNQREDYEKPCSPVNTASTGIEPACCLVLIPERPDHALVVLPNLRP